MAVNADADEVLDMDAGHDVAATASHELAHVVDEIAFRSA